MEEYRQLHGKMKEVTMSTRERACHIDLAIWPVYLGLHTVFAWPWVYRAKPHFWVWRPETPRDTSAMETIRKHVVATMLSENEDNS
jgi:hypothetical protein